MTRKHLVFLTAYFAQDPYGVELAVKMFESITGWSGMGFDAISHHSSDGHVRDCPETMSRVLGLGRSFAPWKKPELMADCPIKECGFRFPDQQRLAARIVMAAGEPHLRWKAEHLSALHTLSNTASLIEETVQLLDAQ